MRQRVLVCGGRDWNNSAPVKEALRQVPRNAIIINGGATGGDACARRSVEELNMFERRNLWLWTCPADWHELERAAGPIRNKQMLDEATPSVVIALPGGSGTRGMVELARLAGLKVIEVGATDAK